MEFREKLDKIINANGRKNWWQPDLFRAKILPLLPKKLEILEFPPSENNNYNCFIYILGLSEEDEIIKSSGGFIYDTFFQNLIDKKVLTYTDQPQDGDYILYRDPKNYPNKITHSGILDKGKVVSKWAWGPLIRHSILDVPASYGNDISYIKAIKREEAANLSSVS